MTERQLKAKAYLEQYGEALRRIRQYEEQLEREQLSIDAIRSSSDNDGMPHGTGTSDPTADKAVRLSERRERLLGAKHEALMLKQEVFDTVVVIGGVESDVLIARYIDGDDWADVCQRVGYEWSQTHVYHRIGLDKVADELRIE
jgi:hypothetical protein